MDMKYIKQIKANLYIYTKKKTSNILEGSYSSIYKGRGMNFEDLREYVIGDNVKDIDWKASARSNKILIKQFVAEKRHNILFVLDTGKKMLADTKSLECKKDIALITTGTLAYIINKHGDSFSALFKEKDSLRFFPFQSGEYNIEKILNYYDKSISNNSSLENVLEYAAKYIKRKTIIFVITDIQGINSLSENILKKLSINHDIMFINISDAQITGLNGFDIEENTYIPKYLLEDEKLINIEKEMKFKIDTDAKEKLKKFNVLNISIDTKKNIGYDIYRLLEMKKAWNKL